MKNKKYGRFALPRVIAALLIGAIIYSITIIAFATRYDNLIISGFSDMGKNYEKILKSYDEGTSDEIFVSIMCNFYDADYVRAGSIVKTSGELVSLIDDILNGNDPESGRH